jgi:hypothetical protein
MSSHCNKCGRITGKSEHTCPKSAWNKGKKIDGWGSWNIGRKMPEEKRLEMIAKQKGKHHSPKTEFKKGVKFPEEEIKRRTLNNSGEKNWRYKTDRNSLVKSEKKHLDGRYRHWSRSVKNRDSWKCKIDNEDCKGRLEAHHILPWSKFPELRYEINNGISLCHFHHPRKRNDEIKLAPFFQELIGVIKV